MALDSTREKALVDGYVGSWGDADGSGSPWRDPGRLTVAARGSLIGVVVLSIGVVIAALAQTGGSPIGPASGSLDHTSGAIRGGTLALATGVAMVIAALLFVLWTRRAYRNLAALGVSGLRLRAGWATASWLIPFVNLVVPKEIIDDLWRSSDPDSPPLSSTWRLRTVPFWINIWWVAVLGASLLWCVAQWLPAGDVLSYSEAQLSALIVAHVALAFSSVMTMILIGDVNRRQAQRIETLLQPADRPEELREDHRRGSGSRPEPLVVALRVGEAQTVAGVAGRY